MVTVNRDKLSWERKLRYVQGKRVAEMVTSRDVARLAGVSQPTVSRALRDDARVSTETKQRIRNAARVLGYVPSETGRALSSGRTRRVGLLLTDLENQFYPHIIASMHDELEAHGYQLVLHTETTDTDGVAERLVANGLDGVILATTTLDSLLPVRLRDRQIPFVYFNRNTPSVAADAALVDSTRGLTEAADELVARGHRRIAGIFGPANTSTGSWRESVLRSALLAHGIHIPAELTVHGPFDFPTGFDGTHQLLRLQNLPTAIVCGNDVVALGALNAAAERGVRVPDDVSILGFDDLPAASWPIIQLSTVAFDLDQMARAATRLLIARLGAEQQAPYATQVFDSRLVLRRTLGPAPVGS